MVSLLLLLAAAWIGLTVSSQLAGPISNLISATDEASQGNLRVRVEVGDDRDEISSLGRAFNNMTNELESQREGLVTANRELDERRRFTETVLSGVSAGVIGLELGSVWARLGAKVTVLEYAKRCLPMMDSDISKQATRIFKRQGLTMNFGVRVTGARVEGDGCVVEAEGIEPIRCDRVLLAVGRVPYTEGLGLESVGITPDERGRIPVDSHFKTSAEGVYAIGDCTGDQQYTHYAGLQGAYAAINAFLHLGPLSYKGKLTTEVPACTFTAPEVARVGTTEAQAIAMLGAGKVGVAMQPLSRTDRAICDGEERFGFIKIV